MGKDKAAIGAITGAGLFVVFLLALLFVGCGEGYSEGERTGIVTKFSKTGLIWKTWEGEMNLGGVVPGREGAMVPNIWEFTVEGDEIVERVKQIQREQKPVTFRYRKWIIRPAPRTETGYFVTEIVDRNGSDQR